VSVVRPKNFALFSRGPETAVQAGMLSEISRFNNINNASQATMITKAFFLM
jgi:hypothetical protein